MTTKVGSPNGARDNEHYLQRLMREAPAILADLESGIIASQAEAFRLAGLKRPRTRRQELKNSWSKASAAEQEECLRWITIQIHLGGRISRPVPISPGVALSEDMERAILRIMESRATTTGGIMTEMGFDALNPLLGLHRGTKSQPERAAALNKWVTGNVD